MMWVLFVLLGFLQSISVVSHSNVKATKFSEAVVVDRRI